MSGAGYSTGFNCFWKADSIFRFFDDVLRQLDPAPAVAAQAYQKMKVNNESSQKLIKPLEGGDRDEKLRWLLPA